MESSEDSRSALRPIPTATYALASEVILGMSLAELLRCGRITQECSLRFTDQRTVHTAHLAIEGEPRLGTKFSYKVVDGSSKEQFKSETEWAHECLRRRGRRIPFSPWNSIRVWINDRDLGSLNELRIVNAARGSAGVVPPEGLCTHHDEKENREKEDASSRGGARRAGGGGHDDGGGGGGGDDDESEEEDEGEWRTLDEIMRNVANEEEEGEEEAPPLEGAQQCEVSSIAAASEGEGEGASAVVDDSTWMKVDAREVRVFGRPFLGFGVFLLASCLVVGSCS